MEIFHYQATYCNVYSTYIKTLNFDISGVDHYLKIPFLPIQFFKSYKILTTSAYDVMFQSSGTGGARSSHYVAHKNIYEESFLKTFKRFFGKPEDYIIIALLPNYIQQGDSSLVYMVDGLIKCSKNDDSGFYLDKMDGLVEKVKQLEQKKKVFLIGVSYALLDLAENTQVKLDNTIILETGGMKGRRKEMIREELHEVLQKSFGVQHIYSEYGMTELLSQAYLTEKGAFECPPWMKIVVRDVYDPLSIKNNSRGGINVIDLANIFSCSFIATQDLGRVYEDGSFEVLGRFDNSVIRGCNLLVV